MEVQEKSSGRELRYAGCETPVDFTAARALRKGPLRKGGFRKFSSSWMDSGRDSSPVCLKPRNPNLLAQYQEIGNMLLICEAASYRIGIAWLPPTAEVRERIRQFQGPLDEFVRLSLVTVNSQALECYVSDLQSSETEDADALCIAMPNVFVRYSLSALLAATLFALNMLIGLGFSFSLLHMLGSSISFGLVAAVFGACAASEEFRRRSFALLLERELNRRRGAGGVTADLGVATGMETKPVSE